MKQIMKIGLILVVLFPILFSSVALAGTGDVFYIGVDTDFNLSSSILAIVLMLTFFVLAERKEDYLLYIFSGVLALVMGVYYIILLEGISYVSWIGVILLLFGVYCFFLSLAYSLKKRSRK